jgi:hypothetical protein
MRLAVLIGEDRRSHRGLLVAFTHATPAIAGRLYGQNSSDPVLDREIQWGPWYFFVMRGLLTIAAGFSGR